MITIPSARPKILKEFESDFGSTHAQAIWKRVTLFLNWWNASLPVGLVMAFYGSQKLANGNFIPGPTTHWKWMDGTAVSNAQSPINGQIIPDLRSLFLKGWSSIGVTGGVATLDLTHSHGGQTGVTNDADTDRLDDGESTAEGGPHSHSISSALTVFDKLPPYVEVQYFINIAGATTQQTLLSFKQLDNNLVRYGDIVSVELLDSTRQNIDYLNMIMPIGSIWPIMTNIPGVLPDPDVWQECNGSQITNEASPLKSSPGLARYTPDMTDRFIKVPASLGLVGTPAGTNTYAGFGHAHGGRTGQVEYGDNADTDDDLMTATGHHHTISGSLVSTYDMRPPFYTVKYFMKMQ